MCNFIAFAHEHGRPCTWTTYLTFLPPEHASHRSSTPSCIDPVQYISCLVRLTHVASRCTPRIQKRFQRGHYHKGYHPRCCFRTHLSALLTSCTVRMDGSPCPSNTAVLLMQNTVYGKRRQTIKRTCTTYDMITMASSLQQCLQISQGDNSDEAAPPPVEASPGLNPQRRYSIHTRGCNAGS